ncbi:MAG: molybdopterin-dependent oxidoreductase [Rhodospirillales bacterium]|nr:molybdopterin-dependent oxidoreductase [Rhodospirillales bacterium]
MTAAAKVRKVPTYCYQCVAGPDLLTVKVVDGVATEVEPNFEAADIHPAAGKVCVKAFGLVQKTYNPNRVLTPMKRTNPRKGKDEDPGFVPISWDEALDTIAAKLNAIKASGNVLDESGFPRVAASFGGGGTPQSYLGTFPAFLAAWKVIDFSFGSGQGVKCYHSEHLYGELWHRAFTVCPDTPHTKYVVSFGANIEASGGVCGVYRHAEARARGVTRIQVEPHLSVTAGCSAEWVPIKPKTDAAFLFAMMNVMLHERPRQDLDLNFLKHHTASGYLVAPNGFYLRDPESRKPLVWDTIRGAAVPFDMPGIEPALEGAFVASGIEVGADDDAWEHTSTTVSPGFAQFLDHLRPYTPEWAESVCEVPATTIRRIANDYLDHAEVGATVEVDGRVLPYRPVAITLGKTVSNGWGGYECCWARTMIACLVGGLEVPGGTLGTTVRLNRSGFARLSSVRPGADGFMDYPMNATDAEHWKSSPTTRNGYRMLVPLAANTAWSQALGPTHLAWMFVKNPPKGWPQHSLPDVWFIYRTNPAISFWDTPQVSDAMTKFPFVVAFAYTHDETNHMADILLPDATDLESTQLIRVGGTKFIEQFWDYHGFALRQPVAGVRGDARDFSWIATELAERTGLLEPYNAAINRGGAGIPLNGEGWDFRLDETAKHSVEDVWDAVCRAASAEITEGESTEGLDWYKEHGYRVAPFPRLEWYLFPRLVDSGLRFEMPYQERLWRIGVELGRRLHERDIHWWDNQLSEYQAMPKWKDFPGLWEKAVVKAGGKTEDFPFWLLTARSMQYAWGGNVGVQMIREVAENVAGHRGVIINAATAEKLGIEEGDLVEVGSTLRSVSGKAVLRHGIRPDTLLMIGQFGHWATPLAKNFDTPSMNSLTPMDLDLTDATGSGADVVRVFLRKVRR